VISFARRIPRLALLASLAVAMFFLPCPNYVIRPQRHQGARELLLYSFFDSSI
jgi:hypothetical protein